MPSSPLPLLPESSSHLPLLISLASLLSPQDQFGRGGGPWRAEDQPGSSAVSPGLSGRGNQPLHSSPVPPGWPLPPASPDLPDLPPMPPGPTRPGWGFGWGGTSLAAQQAPWPEWVRRLPSALFPLFPESLSRLPLLNSPASGEPILSGLHFFSPLSPPSSYQFTLGFLLSPWASESPTSGRQVPWLWGDANCVSSHTRYFLFTWVTHILLDA